KELPFHLDSAPLVAMGILIVPLFDTARVFTLRIANKKGPFSPDRNHTHHILVDYLKLSHRQASLTIAGFNLIFVVILIIMGSTSSNIWMIMLLLLTCIVLAYLFFRLDYSMPNLKRKVLFNRKIKGIRHRFNLYPLLAWSRRSKRK